MIRPSIFTSSTKNIFFTLIGIFILSLLIRLLFFPDNVYFAYDQARDAFAALDILKGDFKIIGPPSFASDKLFPGPLIYYFYAPVYFLFGPDPTFVSLFQRFYNSLGIFLTFAIGSIIFNRKIGLIAAIIFAISYEQTQYTLLISHQPMAVVTVLMFYLGFALVLFKNEPKGLILAFLGWGLSIQFHYGYVLLGAVVPILAVLFWPRIKTIPKGYFLLSSAALFLTLSSFILSEFKYHFFSAYLSEASATGGGINFDLLKTLYIPNRFIHDLFLANYSITPVIGGVIMLVIFYLLRLKQLRPKIIFLVIWLIGGLLPYLISGVSTYYYSAAASVSLILILAYLIVGLSAKHAILGILLLLVIIGNNFFLILTNNSWGPGNETVIQKGMLLEEQKKILDYIYQSADKQPFSIGALAVPLSVPTTWSYLFEWYGQKQYGYLPVWGGTAAEGFPGSIPIITKRSALPQTQYFIVEPVDNILPKAYIQKVFQEEDYFTKVVEEKRFGTIMVQKRLKI